MAFATRVTRVKRPVFLFVMAALGSVANAMCRKGPVFLARYARRPCVIL